VKAALAATVIFTIFIPARLSLKARTQTQGVDRSQTEARIVSGKVYSFERITSGVYYATSSGPMATGGNHPIIVNEADVMIVDDGTTPRAALALLDDLRLITTKPVRWVVNTHFHYDHTDGNSVFGPEVEIVGHEFVRHAMVDLSQILSLQPLNDAPDRLPAERYEKLYELLSESGVKVCRDGQSIERLREMRALYEGYAEALSHLLQMPLPPWLADRPFKDNWQTVAKVRARTDAANPPSSDHETAAGNISGAISSQADHHDF